MSVVDVDSLMELGRSAGLTAVGVASAEPFADAATTIGQRKQLGLHAGMSFTYRNPGRSTDPSATLPGVRSLIVGALDYHRERPRRPESEPVARVASYAWEDHYRTLRSALEILAAELRSAGHRAAVIADQNHLVDRAAAHRAGIGWWGKSANILVPGVGSMVVLGSVLTDAALEPTGEPVADGCGTCTKCLDGCPTGAIVAEGVVDARRCLAWLVQADGVFPIAYRESLGDRLYGCDDCQDVCPPNMVHVRRPAPEGAATAWVRVVEMLTLSNDELIERHGRWYIPNRDARYLRRNALIVLGNIGDSSDERVVSTVEAHLQFPDALVRAHAVWAARRLGLPVPTSDPDAMVRAELEAVVDPRPPAAMPDNGSHHSGA